MVFAYASNCLAFVIQVVDFVNQEQRSPFIFNRSAGAYWIAPTLFHDEEALNVLQVTGWLLGQCIHNHCSIGINLPDLFFKRLLEEEDFEASCSQLQHHAHNEHLRDWFC